MLGIKKHFKKKFSIGFWILLLGILRSKKFLVAAVGMELLILAMMIFGGRTVHPCWVSGGRSMLYFSSFLLVASCGTLLL